MATTVTHLGVPTSLKITSILHAGCRRLSELPLGWKTTFNVNEVTCNACRRRMGAFLLTEEMRDDIEKYIAIKPKITKAKKEALVRKSNREMSLI